VNETRPVGFNDSSIELAVENGDIERVTTALSAGADPNAVGSILSQRLWTIAFENESDEIVRAFVMAGADLDRVDSTGRPFLLALAARGESSAQLKRLLDLGAATSAVDADGWTALHVVASYGYFISASLLLERGADRHAQTKDGKTPLDFATINGHSRVRKLLLG
jgi:ankyrin repeat protein